jgi:hypothetical protein
VSLRFILAAYDTDGKMLGASTEQVDLQALEETTQTMEWDKGQAVGRIVVFLLEPTTLSPLCESQEIPLK